MLKSTTNVSCPCYRYSTNGKLRCAELFENPAEALQKHTENSSLEWMNELNSLDKNSYFCKIRGTWRKIFLSYVLRRNRCCQVELVIEQMEEKIVRILTEAISFKCLHIIPVLVEKQDAI